MYQSKDESELLQGINDRNEIFFQEFYNLVILTAVLISKRIVKDQRDAEELANNAFVKTIRSPAKFGTLQKACYFVYKTTRRESINHLKSPQYTKRPLLREELLDTTDETDIEASIHFTELLKEINEQIKKRPKNQQLIYQLYEADKKTAEIARILNKTTQYVLNIKKEVKDFIKEIMRSRDDLSG